MEVLAIVIFAGVIAATWRASGKPLAFYDAYIACALFWFVAQAIYEAVYLAATLSTAETDLVPLVATWQAPLRDIQIHGFALMMILGVSQRLFHHFYGFKEPNRRLSLGVLAALNLALLGEVFGLVLGRLAGHAWMALWYASVLVMMGSVLLLLWDWRIDRKPQERDRSLKFLRAAYVWLLISLAMLVLWPVHQFGVLGLLAPESDAAQMGFSHAYYGAIRHAITVGFFSLMIVGVAAKVVPTLNGVDPRSLRPLWIPFVLINLGCALRVLFQTLTDMTSLAFPVAGVSGLLEVAGLAVWAAHLWRIMRRGARVELSGRASDKSLDPTAPITASARVGDVLDLHPYLLDTFLSFGFHPLSNPWLRRMLAHTVTLEQACRLLGVDIQKLLEALNKEREKHAPSRMSLPVLEMDSRDPCCTDHFASAIHR
jgi:hypothetical protein